MRSVRCVRTDAPRWAPPLLAIQFLTRLPVPWLDRLTPDQARDGLARATGWLPLVGGAIGAGDRGDLRGGSAGLAARRRGDRRDRDRGVVDGAFHEDAVADFCDGFGGSGRSAAGIRRIMKDSRIGSYGAIGLGLAVALRVATTAELPLGSATASIVAAAAFGRLCAVILLGMAPPAAARRRDRQGHWQHAERDRVDSAAADDAGHARLRVRRPVAMLGAIAATGLWLLWLARELRRRIGGSTGDCLGFAAYMGQLALLLAATAAG